MSFPIENLINTIHTLSYVTKENLHIVSLKYDKINKHFNRLTTTVLILSSLITMTNALFLTMQDTILSHLSADNPTVFIGTTTSLFLSTTMTILTSIIRFRNYRENMEKLKEYQQKLLDIYISLEKEQSTLTSSKSTQDVDISIIQQRVSQIRENMEKLNIFFVINFREYLKLKEEVNGIVISPPISSKENNTIPITTFVV